MSRKLVFVVLYGVALGLLWAAFLNHAGDSPLIVTIIRCVVLSYLSILPIAFCGWGRAGASEMPTKRRVILLPFLPLVFLASLVGMGFLLLMIAPMWPFFALRHMRSQRRFRRLMKSKGRFISVSDLRPKLDGGTGTLIVECHTTQRPFRIWWTEDDLSSLGRPLSTREEFQAFYDGQEHPFNTRCLKEHLDAETGRALLTSLPASHTRLEKLAHTFPSMKIVRVIRPFPGQPNVQAESREQPDGE
jgi:hypothetical protein